MSRLQKSIKNTYVELVGKLLSLVIAFVTRTVFIYILGEEYLGVNGLFTNILSMLSLTELGIGASIIYALYKPLALNDTEKVKSLMRLYRRAYTAIAIVVTVIGFSLTPFLHIFIAEMPDIPNITLIYMLFVLNSSASYLCAYKRSLPTADQKKYIVSIYHYCRTLVLNILQVAVLLIFSNYILYLLLQIITTMIENILITRRVNQQYPYIKEKDIQPLPSEDTKAIKKNVIAMLAHKIGGVVVDGTDSLLLSKFVSIVAVGLYSNYLLLISAFKLVIGICTETVVASVGNLAVLGSTKEQLKIFRVLNFVVFTVASYICIGSLLMINDFIYIWIGESYLLSDGVVFVIILNLYLYSMRRSVLTFRGAYGLYWEDRFKPLAEAIINLVSSIILVRYLGMVGIFLGTTISTVTTCFWVEPYILFKYGLKQPLALYFIGYMKYTVVLIVTCTATYYTSGLIQVESIVGFIAKGIVVVISITVINGALFFRTEEFKYIKSKVLKIR